MRRIPLFLVLAASLVVVAGCRKARQAPPPPAAPGAAAAGDVAAPAAEAGVVAPDPELVPEPEADWAGLADDEVARRSGISLDDCGLALAEGDGVRISVCDFIREVNSLPPRFRSRFDSLERRKELLEEMVSLAVMELEAREKGIEQDPETQFYLERLLAEKMEARLRGEIRSEIRAGITAQDEAEYFEAHRDRFDRPETVSAAHIVVGTEAEARAVIAQLLAGEGDRTLFARLAQEKSLDAETKERGGNLNYFTRPEAPPGRYRKVDPAIAEAAFGMQRVGEIRPEPVQTAAGWHVLKLVGRRAAVSRSLDQVRSTVRVSIEEERFEAAWEARLQQIRTEVGVELFPEVLPEVFPRVPSEDELRRLHDEAHGHAPPPPVPVPGPPAPPVPVPPAAPAAPATP